MMTKCVISTVVGSVAAFAVAASAQPKGLVGELLVGDETRAPVSGVVVSLECDGICIDIVNQPCPIPCTSAVYIYECNTPPGPPDGTPDQGSSNRVISECIDNLKYRVTPITVDWGQVETCEDLAVVTQSCRSI